MAPDPERPIESLLRRYARKRRERAGEAWTVHPVTRRLLQQEVARQFPKKKSFGTALGELLRRRWLKPLIAVAGAAAVIMVGLILRVRQDGRTDNSRTASADSAKLVAKNQPASQVTAGNGTGDLKQF